MRSLIGHAGAVRAMAYAPGPEPLLATASDDRSVRLWDLHSGEALDRIACGDGLLCLAFSPDGKRLAVGGRAGLIACCAWPFRRTGDGLAMTATASAFGPLAALSFTSDGRALLAGVRSEGAATGSHGLGRLTCWNLDPPQPLCQLDWTGCLGAAAFAPARDLLAVAGHARAVEFLEVGRSRQGPAFWMPSRVRALAFSPGEARYLAVAGGRTVSVWDVEAKEWRSRCVGHRGDVNTLAFSPDGLTLLSGGMDRSVRLFETLSGRQLAAWEWKVGVVNALAFATDGMTAAVAGEKPQVIVWDVDEG